VPKGKLTSKYDYLLQDPDFTRWYDDIKRGSIVTAHHWLRRIGYVHVKSGKTPKDMAKSDQKQATAFLLDVVSAFEREGKNGGYIANFVKPIKNWLEFNGITIQQKIKIPGRGGLARVGDERPPTQDGLRKILNMADFRQRTAAALVAFSGLRPAILGNYVGMDGLQIRDMPELKLGKSTVELDQTPTLVHVRNELSKAGHQFFTFLCQEGCDYLKQYLEWRLRRGEELTAHSPIITPVQERLVGQHIRTPMC
jgi:hypothetical protein